MFHFSISKDFGLFLVEEKDDSPRGQVDLKCNSVYKWYLVGFWTDLDGKYDSWSVELKYNDFWRICSSDYFTFIKALFSD
jgi:hypothetical protein